MDDEDFRLVGLHDAVLQKRVVAGAKDPAPVSKALPTPSETPNEEIYENVSIMQTSRETTSDLTTVSSKKPLPAPRGASEGGGLSGWLQKMFLNLWAPN